MNRENFEKVLEHIKSHPETWDQSQWHCGTKHCIAGWAQILSGKKVDANTVRRDARLFLQLPLAEANYLFSGYRTLKDFVDYMEIDRAGYDRAGYNRDGYDRAGYNRAGYNRAGYNRAGLDIDGLRVNDKGEIVAA